MNKLIIGSLVKAFDIHLLNPTFEPYYSHFSLGNEVGSLSLIQCVV